MNLRPILFLIAAAVIAPPTALRADPPPLDALPVLITVNTSDPGYITFTGTPATPYVSNSDYAFFSGITLANFFTSDPLTYETGAVASNKLHPVGNEPDTGSDHYSGFSVNAVSGSLVDMNLFSNDINHQVFTLGSTAFAGTTAVDFATWFPEAIPVLPGAGAKGYLFAGFEADDAVLLGAWAVVPEPSTAVFLLAGAALLLVCLRRPLKTARS